MLNMDFGKQMVYFRQCNLCNWFQLHYKGSIRSSLGANSESRRCSLPPSIHQQCIMYIQLSQQTSSDCSDVNDQVLNGFRMEDWFKGVYSWCVDQQGLGKCERGCKILLSFSPRVEALNRSLFCGFTRHLFEFGNDRLESQQPPKTDFGLECGSTVEKEVSVQQ